MPIDFASLPVRLHGLVAADDADALFDHLQRHPGAALDLADCSHVHPAVLQVMLHAGTTICAWPRETTLARWLRQLPGLTFLPTPIA